MLLRILKNLAADRTNPPLTELRRIEDAEDFLWSMLPHAARSFSLCIALLPMRLARPVAVAYLYCRMLDTYEDLVVGTSSKVAALLAYVDRFADSVTLSPVPVIAEHAARDARDRAHLLLIERADLVDRVYSQLPSPQREAIRKLVRRMGFGMIWSTEVFAHQEGCLRDSEQLSRYCWNVLGNPLLFAEEMQRIDMGITAAPERERLCWCAEAGEAIQLANVTRDLEKDCARGAYYHPRLMDASRNGGVSAEAFAAVRRGLIRRALKLGRSFEPWMKGIPSRRISLARGGALMLVLFTVSYYQRACRAAGLSAWEDQEELHRLRFVSLWLQGVLSRTRALKILDRFRDEFDQALVRTNSNASKDAFEDAVLPRDLT